MRLRILGLLAGVIAGGVAPLAHADVELGELSKVVDSFKVGLEVNSFYRADVNPFFGGSRSLANGKEASRDDWGEIFAKMRFTAGKKLGWADVQAQFAPMYTLTAGADGYGAASDQSGFDVNQAWIEIGNVAGKPVGVRVGRQDIQIEKWFLVGQGDTQDAAYWLFYNYSFPFAVQVNADFSRVRVTAFWARPGTLPGTGVVKLSDASGDVDLYGANLHVDLMKDTYLYGGVYRAADNTDLEGENPDHKSKDITAWDIGGQLKLFDSLVLEGEYVYETGDNNGLDRKASAWWASAGYTFPVALSPFLRGTYVFYSGDKDPTDDKDEGFNPLYSSFIGWNRWIQGEQTGELWLGKTNKKVAIAEVGFSPIPPMLVTLMYLNHKIVETDSFGTDSDKWGDEVNLFMDYQVNDQVFLHLGAGYMKPGDAAKEVTGDDKNAYFGQVWLKFSI